MTCMKDLYNQNSQLPGKGTICAVSILYLQIKGKLLHNIT